MALLVVVLGSASLPAQTQPADASFSYTSELNFLGPPLTQFGTFRQNNPGATLNFRVYNRPAPTGTTSPMSLVNTMSIGDSAAIALQTGTVSGLQPTDANGNPYAPMQLILPTSQVGNLQVSYTMEFASDSLPSAPHESLAIAAYATVLRHGDFNADGKVDAGDYVVWRKTRGQSVSPPYSRADDNGDGLVTDADYNAWRNYFTGTFGSGSSNEGTGLSAPLVVPEPAASFLSALAATLGAILSRRRRHTAE
jgi:hypothetical protein